MNPVVTRSDSVHFRWSKDGSLVSTDSALDFDASKAMLYSEAARKQSLIDLLFVFSGGAHKLMSPAAAKAAGDLDYADGFDNAKIADVKFVNAAALVDLTAALGAY